MSIVNIIIILLMRGLTVPVPVAANAHIDPGIGLDAFDGIVTNAKACGIIPHREVKRL